MNLHEIGQIAEQGTVSLVFSFFHHPGIFQHLRNTKNRIKYMYELILDMLKAQLWLNFDLCKHRVLVDGPVLHPTFPLPDDLLVLLEPPIEQVHLQRKMEGRIKTSFERSHSMWQ